MVGILGSFGPDKSKIQKGSKWIIWNDEKEQSNSWKDSLYSVIYSEHGNNYQEYPIELENGLLWVVGRAFSHKEGNKYVGKSDYRENISHGEYIGEIIDEFGIEEAVSKLNGEFAGIVYNEKEKKAKIFLDRLGSRPIYCAKNHTGLTISSNIQACYAVTTSPDEFDLSGTYEFLTLGRTLGRKTPIQDITKLPPASVSTYDVKSNELSTNVYWTPTYEPKDKSLSYFTSNLNEILEEFFDEVLDSEQSHGLLLSGGSDSRLLIDFIGEGNDCYHMNDWMDSEAKIANEVADVTGNNFVFLERSSNHYSKVLEQGGELSSFTSWFEQGHALGYDGIDFPDVMFTGQFSDSILGGYHYPTRTVTVPLLKKSINTPFAESVGSIDEYIDIWERGGFGRAESLPEYLRTPPSLREILNENIRFGDGGIYNHSIHYPSFRAMLLSHSYYPLTNTFTFLFYESMNQHVPTISPFLDNRVIDLALSMPLKYHLRGKIVERAITARNDRLAGIAYPKSGIALSRHPYIHYLSRLLREFKGEDSSEYAEPYYRDTSPWVNHAELIRSNPFLFKYIDDHEDVLDEIPFLDPQAVYEMCEEHNCGTNNRKELYALATLLSVPSISTLVEETER